MWIESRPTWDSLCEDLGLRAQSILKSGLHIRSQRSLPGTDCVYCRPQCTSGQYPITTRHDVVVYCGIAYLVQPLHWRKEE